MEQRQVIERIAELGRQIIPEGASLWLYGSRARGDARSDSDYDLLILLDKDKITMQDRDYSCHFFMNGLNFGSEVNAHTYTKSVWSMWSCAPFNQNVEEDKVVLIRI